MYEYLHNSYYAIILRLIEYSAGVGAGAGAGAVGALGPKRQIPNSQIAVLIMQINFFEKKEPTSTLSLII